MTVPCSHIGHIFRKRSPYKWKPGVNVVKKNGVRLAEVWLDDYKVTTHDEHLHAALRSLFSFHSEILLRTTQP